MKDPFQNINKIHFIGIGGIGISALAKLALAKDIEVSGSDACASEITRELEQRGAQIAYEQVAENITDDIDLIIYTSAIPPEHSELKAGQKFKITCLTYPQFLGLLSSTKPTIAISGTNGKTTTTAMLGLMLEQAEQDPFVIVGSKVKSFEDGNLRIGQGDFVVEACEYKANMLNLFPQTIILTNIEEDHLDYYKDIIHIKQTFAQFISNLPDNGVLVVNADDEYCLELAELAPEAENVITYGLKNQEADVQAKNIQIKPGQQSFDLYYQDQHKANIILQVPGQFNIYNALAALSYCLHLNLDMKPLQDSLKNFNGTWRRFEKIGKYKGAQLISDYAHHPSAVAGTIKAAQEFYPEQRIVAVFQPHHQNRVLNLFGEFVESLRQADMIVLQEIYNVTGREEGSQVSSADLVKSLAEQESDKPIFFTSDAEDTKKILAEQIRPDDIILIMGAGDIYDLSLDLLKA